jgi:hypothetical protein
LGGGWSYRHEGHDVGPIPRGELVRALRSLPEPTSVLVCAEGAVEWIAAGSVPEIARLLSVAGGQGGVRASTPAGDATRRAAAGSSRGAGESATSVEAVATLYRRLVLLVGLQIVMVCLSGALARPLGEAASVLFVPVFLGILAAAAVTGYRLSGLLGVGSPGLWAIGMFLPYVNVLVLLGLSSKAQAWCRRHGIAVGLLGPTRASLEAYRRSSR